MSRAHVSASLASTLLLFACTPSSATPNDAAAEDAGTDSRVPADAWVVPIDRPPFEAANAVDESDPRWEGQQRFLFDAFGTERYAEWPPADFMLALMTSEPDVFGDQYASFGFVPNPDDDFPVGFTRGLEDPTLVHATCAMCHTARLPDGRIWLGAPNGALEIGRFQVEVSARWVAAGHEPLIDENEAAKALSWGPGRFGADIGRAEQAIPVDFPPYFLLGERSALNYLGTSADARSEMYLSLFGLGAGAPNEAEALVPFPTAARFDPLVTFMEDIDAPAPAPGDAVAIEAGRLVFERERCTACHDASDPSEEGVTPYDRAPDGRDRIPGDDPAFERGSIHTDYWHRTLIDGEGDAGMALPDDFADYVAFIGRHRLRVAASDGYRVQNLHGLWATAPYLHNGSVPTLGDLLRPAAERPTTFLRGTFEVDTTLAANGNGGHEFGVTIDDADRDALVAYLLSL